MNGTLFAMVARYDSGKLRKPVVTSQGYLRADAYPTKAGIFTYTRADGSKVRELRPESEVFSAASLSSLSLAPVTDEHPPVALTSSNTRALSVGTVGELVKQDGEHVLATVQVTDPQVIAKIQAGKVQLSCGYKCDVENTPGVWQGKAYDAVQHNIAYNHLALVSIGRAGPDCGLHMDAADATQDEEVIETASIETRVEFMTMVKVRLDGVDYDASESAAQAFAKALDAAKAQAAKDAARADSAEADKQKAQEALQVASDPKRIADAVAGRLALERVAGKAQVKADGLSDDEIKKQVIVKVRPTVKLDGKDAAYISAAFDLACEQVEADAAKNPALAAVRAAAHGATTSHADGTEVSADAARKKYLERQENAWKEAK